MMMLMTMVRDDGDVDDADVDDDGAVGDVSDDDCDTKTSGGNDPDGR